MDNSDTVIAVFHAHDAAEAAVKKLAASGFPMTSLSVVGKGFHTEEKVTGFYNMGDRVKVWGKQGAFWGGLWGLFFGGLFLTIPVVGPVIALGYIAATVLAAVEGAVTIGALGALSAALFSIGIPKDSVIQYEAAVKSDGFLVMAHGSAAEMARAKALLGATPAAQVDWHTDAATAAPAIPLGAAKG